MCFFAHAAATAVADRGNTDRRSQRDVALRSGKLPE